MKYVNTAERELAEVHMQWADDRVAIDMAEQKYSGVVDAYFRVKEEALALRQRCAQLEQDAIGRVKLRAQLNAIVENAVGSVRHTLLSAASRLLYRAHKRAAK